MKFCSQCGKPVSQRIPEGDTRLSFVYNQLQHHLLAEPELGAILSGRAV